ncbi:MAG: hypothetical protein AAGD11_08120 [Planctomycetota bacterium]
MPVAGSVEGIAGEGSSSPFVLRVDGTFGVDCGMRWFGSAGVGSAAGAEKTWFALEWLEWIVCECGGMDCP